MSNSFSGKNTNEKKYDFHVGETPECIECKNDNVLKCLVETLGSHYENPPPITILTLRKRLVPINDRERIIEKTLEGYSIWLIVSLDDIKKRPGICREYRGGIRRSKLTLEIKESLQTYVDLERTKTQYELAEWPNVHLMLMCQLRVTLVPERRYTNSTIELRTIYAISFRELEVDNDDIKFVFLDEVGFAVLARPGRGHNMRGESAYLSVTAARSRNISVVAAINKYGMIYYKIHERAVNGEDLKLSIKEINKSCQRQGILTPIFVMNNARIHHYRGWNDDEEIASYRIKYLPPYSPFLNPIENVFSVWKNKVIRGSARTKPQLRILICEK
ncbi:DDE-like endonuclease, partial [Hamiltosporidium magnivora]